MSERVRISTRPKADDYDVLIEPGALGRMSTLVPKAHTYAIVTDSNVAPLYAETIKQQVSNSSVLTFEAGETNKTATTWLNLTGQMIANKVGRDTCVIALGGGVTGDLAGFVAATYMRGVPVVQVPTTLLAMIDASIGGKTGIDVEGGKNLVGAFHQPHIVIIDPDVLRTLPKNELRYGLAEAIKHGAIADAEYLAWIGASIERIRHLDPGTLKHLIQRSVEIKAHFVSSDVREAGARAALNFGHTIGHALEGVTRYAMPHGEAVACGMMVEALAGEALGVTEAGTARILGEALAAAGLPVVLERGIDAAEIVAATRTDKKGRSGDVHYAVPGRIGEFHPDDEGQWTKALPGDVVKEVMRGFR